jgi:hypothetical protein
MAGTLTLNFFAPSGNHCYALVFDQTGKAYNPTTNTFATYVQASGSLYKIDLAETAGRPLEYERSLTFNAGLGIYEVEIFKAASSGVYNRQADRLAGTALLPWNGTKEVSLLDIGTNSTTVNVTVSGIADDLTTLIQEVWALKQRI